MAPRQKLQNLLEMICPNVYFQPPEDAKMVYPCIVYELMRGNTRFADNSVHKHTKQYEMKLISRDPDDPLGDQLIHLPYTIHDRFYVAAGLNHTVFSIHF